MTEKAYHPAICNICGSSKYRRIHFFAEWNYGREPVSNISIIRCSQCGVRRRMPGIIDDYEAQYHAPYLDQGQAIHPHQLMHFADLMTARLRRFGEKNVAFLDVGCSTGRTLQLARTMGFDATGLDLSRWAVEHCAKQGFPVRQGSLINQWPEAGLFDVIHCCHTIEHVPDPVAYLQAIHRLLKPGGHLMLAFPNYLSLPRLIQGEKWIWCLDSHLWQFTVHQMNRLLVAQGFEIVFSRTHHGMSPQSYWKRKVLDFCAACGFADGANLIALRS